MSASTKIEWATKTWNPLRGCSKVSEGCRNCYAIRQAHRFSGAGQPYEGLTEKGQRGPNWSGEVRLVESALAEPFRWRKPERVFVNSMSDLFHPEVPDQFIVDVFTIMAESSHHTFQVLTKRPERMNEFLTDPYMANNVWLGTNIGLDDRKPKWPLPNVWLGVSVENRQAADERIPLLLQTPAAVRFLSCEPLLGHVDLDAYWGELGVGIDWVIVGGESGPGARPMHPDWARSMRDQCQDAGVAFHFKQWGSWKPAGMPHEDDDYRQLRKNERWLNYAGGMGFHGERVYRMQRMSKEFAGRLLDGRTWDEFPEVREGGDVRSMYVLRPAKRKGRTEK